MNKVLVIPDKNTLMRETWAWRVGIVPIPEYKFHPTRKWRIDYAFPDVKLAVEIEGGVWTRGRHTRGAGFKGDMEKYNALTEAGWHLLRYEPKKIDYDQIKRVIDINLSSLVHF